MFFLEKLNIRKAKYRNLHHSIPAADFHKQYRFKLADEMIEAAVVELMHDCIQQ
jgi:hypothetical protein